MSDNRENGLLNVVEIRQFISGLMYLFVSVLGMKTDLLKTAAKILATGIVFIWNYLSRKLWIYKNAKSPDKE